MGLFHDCKQKYADKPTLPRFFYTKKEPDKCETHIKKCYGDYAEVFHEIFSPDIHLDVIPVPPSEAAPYYKLVTMGGRSLSNECAFRAFKPQQRLSSAAGISGTRLCGRGSKRRPCICLCQAGRPCPVCGTQSEPCSLCKAAEKAGVSIQQGGILCTRGAVPSFLHVAEQRKVNFFADAK